MQSGFFSKAQAVADKPSGMLIPNMIHIAWFGSMLPEKYARNVIAARQCNPDYSVILYSDSASMTGDAFEKLTNFCAAQDIKLTDLFTVSEADFANLKHIRFELNMKKWARASDITRATALYDHGGVYLDTDLWAKKPFGKLHAPTGTLQYIVTDNGERYINIYFMAAVAKHPVYKACISLLDSNYTSAQKLENHLSWMTTDDTELCIYATGNLSGGVFHVVLESTFTQAWLNKCHYDVSKCVDIYSDKTWLPKGAPDIAARHAFVLFATAGDDYLKSDEYKLLIRETKAQVTQLLATNSSRPAPTKKT